MTASRPGDQRQPGSLSRREFGTGVTAVSIGLVSAQAQAHTTGSTKIRLGMIGCGGRGTWIAKLFMQHGAAALHVAQPVPGPANTPRYAVTHSCIDVYPLMH